MFLLKQLQWMELRYAVQSLADIPTGKERVVWYAMQRLGEDILRSSAVRWTRLCEDSAEKQEELRQNLARSQVNPLSLGTGKSEMCVWQLPKRVLVVVAGQKICLCAYQFPDETRKVCSVEV